MTTKNHVHNDHDDEMQSASADASSTTTHQPLASLTSHIIDGNNESSNTTYKYVRNKHIPYKEQMLQKQHILERKHILCLSSKTYTKQSTCYANSKRIEQNKQLPVSQFYCNNRDKARLKHTGDILDDSNSHKGIHMNHSRDGFMNIWIFRLYSEDSWSV
jgi:hypothetical protein